MHDQLRIRFRARRGELVRILSAIERRRFTILAVGACADTKPDTTTLYVTVHSDRGNAQGLLHQLENLVEVFDARLIQAHPSLRHIP